MVRFKNVYCTTLLEASIGELGLLEFILTINEVFWATEIGLVNNTLFFTKLCTFSGSVLNIYSISM